GLCSVWVRERCVCGCAGGGPPFVGAGPPQCRLSAGRFVLSEPGEPLFPAELVRTAPEVSVVLEASRSRERTDLAYVLQGATWEALYQIVLGGGGASVTGTATVTSHAIRADSPDVQVVAGAIRRTRLPPRPREEFAGERRLALSAAIVSQTAATEAAGGEP